MTTVGQSLLSSANDEAEASGEGEEAGAVDAAVDGDSVVPQTEQTGPQGLPAWQRLLLQIDEEIEQFRREPHKDVLRDAVPDEPPPDGQGPLGLERIAPAGLAREAGHRSRPAAASTMIDEAVRALWPEDAERSRTSLPGSSWLVASDRDWSGSISDETNSPRAGERVESRPDPRNEAGPQGPLPISLSGVVVGPVAGGATAMYRGQPNRATTRRGTSRKAIGRLP